MARPVIFVIGLGGTTNICSDLKYFICFVVAEDRAYTSRNEAVLNLN